MGYSTPAEFEDAYATVQATFASNKTKEKAWRRQQLARLYFMLKDNQERLCAAEQKDLRRHAHETMMAEIGFTMTAAVAAYKDLDKLMAPERPARTDPINFMTRATVHKVPVGTVLIMSAWNFPINGLLHPMVDAIAAGCTVVIKPSELVPATQDLLAELVPKYMDAQDPREEMGPHLLHRLPARCRDRLHRRRQASDARDPRARRQGPGHHHQAGRR